MNNNESFHDEDGTPIGVNSKHEPVTEGGNEPFPVYHETYGSAINAIDDYAKSRGFELDQEEYGATYLDAFFKPKPGETKSDSLTLYKDGKPQRKSGNCHRCFERDWSAYCTRPGKRRREFSNSCKNHSQIRFSW